LIREFALLITGIGCALLLGEGAVRVTGVAPRVIAVAEGRYRISTNPLLGYEPIPGLQYFGNELYNYNWRGETNALGFRSHDYPRARDGGSFRVAVLGDSLAEGLWIDSYEQTFPAVIEAELRRNGEAAQVLNFGLVGYNTRQEVAALKEFALQYHPDIVLLEYCLNDRERSDGALLSRLLAKENRNQPGSSGISPVSASSVLDSSELWRFLKFRALPILGRSPVVTDNASRLRLLSDDTVDESLREFGRVVAAENIVGVVAIFPHFQNLVEYRFVEEHARVRAVAEEAGLRVLDLREPFFECERAEHAAMHIDEYHPNAAGHACAGRYLAQQLLQLQKDAIQK